jgi:hypothetical protein
MPMHRFGLTATLAVVALACGNRAGSPGSDATRDTAKIMDPGGPPDPARAAARSDTATALLATGCGGGVTGGGGGAFVTADGRFYRYQGMGPQPNANAELTFVRKDSARAAALVDAAERQGISRVNYSVPSNMTCSLTLTRAGASHEIAWAMGTTPRPIARLVEVAKQLSDAAR